MSDKVEKIGSSLVQYGPYNGRVYLMKYSRSDHPALIPKLAEIGLANGCEKIFAKVPAYGREAFLENGYQLEATTPGFFGGVEDACFFGKYLVPSRAVEKNPEIVSEVISVARAKRTIGAQFPIPEGFECTEATPADAEGMVDVYTEIFKTYPFPIHDPDYLRQTMRENFVYFVMRDQGRIVAVSSCEMDEENSNVEMTDFASLISYQGRGLATALLARMDEAMRARGIKTAFTIARATSFGMNITFAKHGYDLGGTLVNNTNIAGAIESMNVWYKPL